MRKLTILLLLCFKPATLRSQETPIEEYQASVDTISTRIAQANPFLAERFKQYFLRAQDGGTPEPLAIYQRILRNEPNTDISASTVIGHLAQQHLGKFYGIAISATAIPGRLAQQKASDDNTLQKSGVTDDVHAPLLLLSPIESDNHALSIWRETLIYEECVQQILQQVKNPEALAHLTKFFLASSSTFDNVSQGFYEFDRMLTTVQVSSEAYKSKLANRTALDAVVSTARTELKETNKRP